MGWDFEPAVSKGGFLRDVAPPGYLRVQWEELLEEWEGIVAAWRGERFAGGLLGQRRGVRGVRQDRQRDRKGRLIFNAKRRQRQRRRRRRDRPFYDAMSRRVYDHLPI